MTSTLVSTMSYYKSIPQTDIPYTTIELQQIYDPTATQRQTIHYVPVLSANLVTTQNPISNPNLNTNTNTATNTAINTNQTDPNFSIRDTLKSYCIRAGIFIICGVMIVCVLYSVFRKPVKDKL